jgi:hypothetical protein
MLYLIIIITIMLRVVILNVVLLSISYAVSHITTMLSVSHGVFHFINMLSVSYAVSHVTVMPSVFTLNVIRLSVVAPIFGLKNESDVVELGSVNQDY